MEMVSQNLPIMCVRLFIYAKLVSPRRDFAQTPNATEAAAMRAHATCWTEQAKGRVPIAIGLVADPKGFYGIGVLEVDSHRTSGRTTAQRA
jgi:hypothetical protein